MNTVELLQKMISIVESHMESFKSDFYKFDWKFVYDHWDNVPAFIWEVDKSHTHLCSIDASEQFDWMRESEAVRFGFGNYRHKSHWFVRGIGRSRSALYFYFHDGKLESLGNNFHALVDITAPIAEQVNQFIKDEFADEIEWYNKKIPVTFSCDEVRRQFMQLARSEEGEKLIAQAKVFHRYARSAKDEFIVIGSDFAEKSFSFWQERNQQVTLNGGLIYYNEDWHRHT